MNGGFDLDELHRDVGLTARYGPARQTEPEAEPTRRPAVRYADPRDWRYRGHDELPVTFGSAGGEPWTVHCTLDPHDEGAILAPRDNGAGHPTRRPAPGDTAHVPDGRWPTTVAELDWLDAVPIGCDPSYYRIILTPGERP